MSQVATHEEKAPTIAELINQQAPAIARCMSGFSDEERKNRAMQFARIALSTIRNNKKLEQCKPVSLISALMTCAAFDMVPDPRGLVYLVPYKDEATFQLGFRGMIELAIRSGQVSSIFAEVVYRAEVEAGMFMYHGGTERRIDHRYDILKPELRTGDIVGAYAVAEMANGSKQLAFVDRAYLDKRKAASPAWKWSESGDRQRGGGKKDSVWHTWEEEMTKKTAIKALCKTLPQSVEKLHLAIAADDEATARIIDANTDMAELPPMPEMTAIGAADLNAATE